MGYPNFLLGRESFLFLILCPSVSLIPGKLSPTWLSQERQVTEHLTPLGPHFENATEKEQ